MTTLKTLKDIETDLCSPQMYNAAINKDLVRTVSVIQLKQEAIKWIKRLSSHKIYNSNEPTFDCQSQIEWIKHFFNITDSDLE